MKLIAPLIVLFALTGCATTQTATPAFKVADTARLKAAEPWLNTYAADHPADAQKVSDFIAAWKIDNRAQTRTPVTQP